MTNSHSKDRKAVDNGDRFAKSSLPEKIGQNLRSMYDDVLNEDVPDEFLKLLETADKKTGGAK